MSWGTPRTVDIPDLPLPTWQQIADREYEPWHRDRLVVDTAGREPEESLGPLLDAILTAGPG